MRTAFFYGSITEIVPLSMFELRDAIDDELDARGSAPGEAGDLDERAN
jgi:hypothetical protein